MLAAVSATCSARTPDRALEHLSVTASPNSHVLHVTVSGTSRTRGGQCRRRRGRRRSSTYAVTRSAHSRAPAAPAAALRHRPGGAAGPRAEQAAGDPGAGRAVRPDPRAPRRPGGARARRTDQPAQVLAAPRRRPRAPTTPTPRCRSPRARCSACSAAACSARAATALRSHSRPRQRPSRRPTDGRAATLSRGLAMHPEPHPPTGALDVRAVRHHLPVGHLRAGRSAPSRAGCTAARCRRRTPAPRASW